MNDTPGFYRLWMRLEESVNIDVGRLGTFLFPAGVYVYTGSALGGLEARLRRHQSRPAKLHWHIDYFLRHARLQRIERFAAHDKNKPRECQLNAAILNRPGAKIIAPRFGASDCRCATHLVYLGCDHP